MPNAISSSRRPTNGLTHELTVIDKAARALAEATTLGDIKQIRDKAEAVRKYARSAALGLDAQNYAAEIKLRAERKAGYLLASFRLRGGDRKSNYRNDSLKLSDLGIGHNQSARWQLEASLPDDQFEEYLQVTRANGGEIVASEVLRLARKLARNGNGAPQKRGTGRSVLRTMPADSQNGHSARSLPQDRQLQKFDDVLNEVRNHRDLMDEILRPIYTGAVSELHSAERRVLGHLLKEIEVLLGRLERITHT